jgi:hypothetical protein
MDMNMEQQYKYFAFISYNAKDTEWGKRLQRKLEHYRLPATMCQEHGWQRTPIRPVFFAPTDIQPGGLTEELQERLSSSRNLIVICSPHSAQSDWVGREIEFFHSLGRSENIHFFIVDGVPHSGDPATECFNPIIDRLGLPEILGANIHEHNYRLPWLNRERAYAQLVSKLLGVEFDAIWQRHRRRLIRRTIAWTLGVMAIIAALAGVWLTNQPFTATVKLNEASVVNNELPAMQDAVVTMTLDNEAKSDTLSTLSDKGEFANIPHKYMGKEVRMTVTCHGYLPLDTLLTLGRNMTLDLRRDPSVYGNVHFGLWDPESESFIPGAKLEVAGMKITTDKDGHVSLTVPLEKQRKTYQVKAEFPLYNDMITMPCGENDVIEKM